MLRFDICQNSRNLSACRLQALRDQLQAQENQRLHDHVARLEALRDRHIRQLELDFGASAAPEALVRDRRRQRQHQIDRVFEEYRQWLDETRHTEREPYIQVVAVLTGQGAVARPSGQGE